MHPSSASFEAEHVHVVYDEIAQDFSRTRHSRWPFVERFLGGLPAGSLVLDAGTGNGKYLGCRSVLNWDGKEEESLPRGKGKGRASADAVGEQKREQKKGDLLSVGFDMSSGLLGIASGKGHEVVKGDCVDMSCWRRGAFNHAISIATIHHFATPARRVEAIKQMILAVLPPCPPSSAISTTSPLSEAQILIVVWSLEQDPALLGARSARRTTGGKKGAVPVSSLQGADAAARPAAPIPNDAAEEEEQDVFVPWERQEPQVKKVKPPKQPRPPHSRSNHASSPPSEPSRISQSAPPTHTEGAHTSPTPPELSSSAVTDSPSTTSADPSSATKPTFNRYYHLFRQYELSSLCQAAAEQLGLAFSCPADYVLEKVDAEAQKAIREAVRPTDGWQAYLTVREERWERENWVVELSAGWRRA
ncbi:hypothetical protein JCM11251_006503 [Rhodosporidiobolus azoricus]